MNTYCKKKTTVRKRENVFDAILESNSPFLPSTEADEDARLSSKNSEDSVHLFEDTPPNYSGGKKNGQACKLPAKCVRNKAKKIRKPKSMMKESRTQDQLQPKDAHDFAQYDNDELVVEDSLVRRKALQTIDNLPINCSKLEYFGENLQNTSNKRQIQELSQSGSFLFCNSAVSMQSIQDEQDFPTTNVKPFRNVTSRKKRLRPRKSIKYYESTPSDPKNNSNDWSYRTQSCSTPRSVNQSSSRRVEEFNESEILFSSPKISPSQCEEHEEQMNSSDDLFLMSSVKDYDSRRSFVESLVATDAEEAEKKVLDLCYQTDPITFAECISDRMMSDCIKIGEGVYGEVFKSFSKGKPIALKVIPIEGEELVNDCPQKKFEEILPEIVIARELSDLASSGHSRSSNFCQVNRISLVQGTFPISLLQLWDEYAERKRSENDRPDFFTDQQLFIVFEFAHGGCALESFKFQSQREVYSVLRQVVFALAVAEKELEFEHRDLHIGNVLVKSCQEEEEITFQVDGNILKFPTEGVVATIIDFTISRLKKDEYAVFCNISTDEGLFEGSGDIQFDVYRDMRSLNGNNWEAYHPHTNILWTRYLCTKLLTTKRVNSSKRSERSVLQHLRKLQQEIPNFDSCSSLACYADVWYED